MYPESLFDKWETEKFLWRAMRALVNQAGPFEAIEVLMNAIRHVRESK
jgi:hypothetical protein